MKLNKCARLVDPFSKRTHHEVINLTWLIMLAQIYAKVEYIGEAAYQEKMRLQLKQLGYHFDNIEYKPIRIHSFRKWGFLNYLLHLSIVSFRDFFYWVSSPRNCDVFYNNNIYFSLLLFWLCSFFKRNKVFVLCHSELEAIHLKWNGYILYIYGFYLRFYLNMLPFNQAFHFIVLGDRMKAHISKYISQHNQKRFYSIDHPYIRPETTVKVDMSKYGGIRKIGIISVIKEGRGLNNLQTLLLKKFPDDVKLFAISKVIGEVNDPYHELVQLNNGKDFFPSDIYTAYIKEMDCIIMLYDTDGYQLTASGSILEAIWNLKPIIALKNDYFDYLFSKFGKMGELCESVDDMFLCIKEKSYSSDLNLTSVRTKLLPDNIVNILLFIIKSDD